MSPEDLGRVRAVRRSRPPVGPLHFFVDVLRPGYYRGSASPPKGRGLYVVESWGHGAARARLLLGPDQEAWREDVATLDEAESAAAQHAQKQAPKPKAKLTWKAGVGEHGEPEWHTHVDMPIWGNGVFGVPRQPSRRSRTELDLLESAYWHGTDLWGNPGRSMHESHKGAIEAFVRMWRAMANRPTHYYRVFPFRPGYEQFPAGAMRQEGVAEVLELYFKLPKRMYAKMTERQRGITDAAQHGNSTTPVFRWTVKQRKKVWVPEPETSASLAQHLGQFNTGQAFGYFEIVEYTTGQKPKARSLGVWRTPPTAAWRKNTDLRPEKIEVAWTRPEVGQLEFAPPEKEAATTGYPYGVSAQGVADELAGKMLAQVAVDLRLAQAQEDRKDVKPLRAQQRSARQATADTMEEVVTTFGGARAEQIRLEAQAKAEAFLHDRRNKLAHYWAPQLGRRHEMRHIRVRMLDFGGPATRAQLYAEAKRRALDFAAKKEDLQTFTGWWLEPLDDGVRTDFLLPARLLVHEARKTGQIEFGIPTAIYDAGEDRG